MFSAKTTPANAQNPAPSLKDWKVIDLTQALTTGIPIWPGDPAFEVEAWASYDKDGYFINRFSIGEHSGTHWGTPNTFIEGARSADQFTPEELIVPAVVIDIREKAANDADYRLSVDDVNAWEAANGEIPAGSVVILFTGWQDKWSDPEAFLNADADEVLHWPGFGAEAATFLVSERGIKGLGTDTHGADPGNDEEFGASYAMYAGDGMILECLGGLDQLPPTGATLVIGGLPIAGGSGSPARVLALLPGE
ncbi:MAG: cyclase family protein [Anaerolineae bacterium]|nr:cyclase family protein [Anaerolineae bacterium]